MKSEEKTANIIQLVSMPNGGSDLTLKKNIQEIQDGLDRILALRPLTWNWKTDNENEPVKYGFIAQEVEKLFPDLVQPATWHDGTTRKHLATNDLIPYLILALQEQQTQINELKAKLKS